MDKYEYKIRADEIKELIAQGEYVQAAEIADTIDWRRVKSVMMLCTISDLYKINRRYEDARDMLLLAYERRPGGRTICYSLCELSIKMEEFLQAVEYYKEFVQIAPKDPGRYILQYKLYEAQEVSLEERIQVLEELKKRDYREKWAYELAYLYHRVGLGTRCVEECDELILWFGEGKYVIKAMELKMLHQPLSPEQQEKYDSRFEAAAEVGQVQEQAYGAGQYADMSQAYQAGQYADASQAYENGQYQADFSAGGAALTASPEQDKDMDIHVKTVDVGQYNTINLQAELAAGLKEVLGEDRSQWAQSQEMLHEKQAMESGYAGKSGEQIEGTEVFFGETEEIGELQEEFLPEEAYEAPEGELYAEEVPEFPEGIEAEETAAVKQPGAAALSDEISEAAAEVPEHEMQDSEVLMPEEEEAPKTVPDITGEIVMEQMRQEIAEADLRQVQQAEPPKELQGVLSQEADGQISLVMPEKEGVEKQITGQMNIEEILAEWERLKKENAARRKEEVRQHVLQQTGSMFTEFEAAVRDGLLEQLEREKESGGAEEKNLKDTASEKISPERSQTAQLEEEKTTEVSQIEALSDEVEELEEIEEFSEEEYPEEIQPELQAEEEYLEEIQPELQVEEEYTEERTQIQEEYPEEPVPREVKEAEAPQVVQDKAKLRTLTREEKELYAPFIQSKAAREQLVKAIDGISMAAYTGNVIITGEEGMDTLTLAKNMIREVQMTDSNFSGRVAKISGETLNRRNVGETLTQLKNGALIIQKASGMDGQTAKSLHKALQQESMGMIVVLEDTKKAIHKFLEANSALAECFTARVDVEALSNDTLVAFGRQYARELEYSIDELGILALHTRIEDLQTIDHAVTVVEVKEIVDEAIRHANKKTLKHFFDILFAKRYDEEDMIILSEHDFV